MATSSCPKNQKKPRGRPRKPPGQDAQAAAWDFTDFDVSEERQAIFKRYERKFLAMSLEYTQEGRAHIQGRIIFKRSYRWAAVKKLFPPTTSFEATKALADFNYGLKWDSKILCWEDDRHPGKRSIFTEQKDAILAGSNLRECADLPGANYQSFRSAEILMAYIEPPRSEPVTVTVIDYDMVDSIVKKHGSDMYRPPQCGNKLNNWTGYDAHPVVLIDCALHHIDLRTIRAWSSQSPFLLNTKGGARQARYTRLYITRPPDGYQKPQLCRLQHNAATC